MEKEIRVFLGGTCNNSLWREKLIPLLKISYFNPVVDEWKPEDYEKELYERAHADYNLYVITPKLTGYYSLAEIVDDSNKRPNKTIFCYLNDDDGETFTPEQIASLDALGDRVEANGAMWQDSLEEIADFLNSSLEKKQDKNPIYDIFISYGRKHSKQLAGKMYDKFVKDDLTVWFDKKNIPVGVDFQEEINEGIRRSHNFVFLISPHSVKSIYCLKEIELAVALGKRIIPILHVYEDGFESLMHEVVQKLNWIIFDEDINALHAQINQITSTHKSYVESHTSISLKAYRWEKSFFSMGFLLSGKERTEAQKWLLAEFDKGVPPATPTQIVADYITFSKKAAFNEISEAFISHFSEDNDYREAFRNSLSFKGFSTWVHNRDIKSGQNYNNAIEWGIIKSDNVIFIITERSINSEYCLKELEYAVKYQKRIIPVLLEQVEDHMLPDIIRSVQYINFLTPNGELDYQNGFNQLFKLLPEDNFFNERHTDLLDASLSWEKYNSSSSHLLRGFSLDKMEDWLKIASKRSNFNTLSIQSKFVDESKKQLHILKPTVFIAHFLPENELIKKVNYELNVNDKITWFDHEFLPESKEYQTHLAEGIQESANFLAIVTPDFIEHELWQIAEAIKNNKRIILASIGSLKSIQLPENLANKEIIDLSDDFYDGMRKLIKKLDTDKDFVEAHTRWQQKAIEWERSNKKRELLLRGDEFTLSNSWLKNAIEKSKSPLPTDLQKEFISNSENEILIGIRRKKRSKNLLILLVILMGISLIWAGVSYTALLQSQENLANAEQAIIDAKAAKMQILVDAKNIKQNAEMVRSNAEAQQQLAIEQVAQAQSAVAEFQDELKATTAHLSNVTAQAKVQQELADSITKAAKKELNQTKIIAKNVEKKAAETKGKLDTISVVTFAELLGKQTADPSKNIAKNTALLSYAINEKFNKNSYSPSIHDALTSVLPPKKQKKIHNYQITSIAKSPTSNLVVSGDYGGKLCLWNYKDYSLSFIETKSLGSSIKNIEFSSKGNCIVGTANGRIWKIRANTAPILLSTIPEGLDVLKIIGDNEEYVVAVNKNGLHFKTIKTGANVQIATSIDFAPIVSIDARNSQLLIAHKGKVRLLNLEFGNKISLKESWQTAVSSIPSALFLGFNSHCYIGDHHGKIHHVYPVNGKVKKSYIGKHRNIVSSIQISAKDELLISTSYDRTIHIYPRGEKAKGVTPVEIKSSSWLRTNCLIDGNVATIAGGDSQQLHVWPISPKLYANKVCESTKKVPLTNIFNKKSLQSIDLTSMEEIILENRTINPDEVKGSVQFYWNEDYPCTK